ncbi:MAG TPA: T9SS type A sorting domain-containing protein, partial [Crocinitomix sp.]|nr:T9SS type A sorting domain-containing protein [Crocinitomix sp.]
TQWVVEYGPTGFMPGSGTSVNTTTNPVTITGLMSDTDYDFYVYAVCSPGVDSSFTVGPVTFTTIVTCPVVSGLGVSNLTTTSADLNWTAGGIETQWNVEYGMNGFTLGSGTTVNVTTTPTTSISGLTAGTNYQYYVQAICGPGDTAQWVGPFNFMTVISCPQPTNLSAINISQTAANLMWQAGGSETSWNIEYGMAGFTQGTGTMINGTSTNPNYVTGLTDGTDYEFYVQADCGGGDMSTWAGPFSFTTLCGIKTAPYLETFGDYPPSPSIPNCWTNIGSEPWSFNASGASGPNTPGYGVAGAVDHTTGTGNYTWIDASGGIGTNELITPMIDYSSLTQPIVGFWILSNNINDAAQNVITLEGLDAGGNWVMIDQYSGNNPNWVKVSFNIPTNLPTTTQFRLVQVQNPGGNGSAFFNDLLVDDFFVDEPAPCTVNAGTAVAGTICLQAGEPTDLFDAITGYSDGNGTFYYPNAVSPSQSFAANNGSLILSGLDANVPYTFDYVVGGGNCADILSFTYTWSTAANAGGDGAVTTCSYNDVILIQALNGQVDMGGTWTDVNNVGGLVNGIFNANNSPTSGVFTFEYVVSNGTCSDTSVVTVTIDPCLSVNDNEAVTALEVYPNPVNSTLTIANFNISGYATITLVDLQGKVVYTNNVSDLTGNFQIDMSNYESGIYVVRVTTENTNQEIKVVKQ